MEAQRRAREGAQLCYTRSSDIHRCVAQCRMVAQQELWLTGTDWETRTRICVRYVTTEVTHYALGTRLPISDTPGALQRSCQPFPLEFSHSIVLLVPSSSVVCCLELLALLPL